MGLSVAQRVAKLPAGKREEWLRALPSSLLEEVVRGEWWYTARPEQVPPADEPWFVALALAGRGWGKSRSSSEWLCTKVDQHPTDRHGVPTEWLVVAETLADARTINAEGPSGLLRVLDRRGMPHRYKQSPRPMILFPSGAKIYFEGADNPDTGRGYNAAGAVLDEIAKWVNPYDTWYQGIMPSLRADLVGDHPRVMVTTTPKPIDLLKEWVARTDGSVHIMRGSTFDNAANLSAPVLAELKRRYAGTTVGLQELEGQILDLSAGGLFSALDFEKYRVAEAPEELTIAVGVDPALTGEGDEMGVVVVGRDPRNHLYVLADRTIVSAGHDAALHCWRVFAEFGADAIIIENNLGKAWMRESFENAHGELVRAGLFGATATPKIVLVDAKRGKKTRAEPVAQRLQKGELHMVGRHDLLEEQCSTYATWDGKESPDRIDALVHGARWLMDGEKKRARVALPGQYVLRDDNSDYITYGQ